MAVPQNGMAIYYIGGMKKDRYEWLKNNIKKIVKKCTGQYFW